MKEESNYIGIGNPVDIRRDILETSKYTLRNLQLYEDIESLITQKNETISKFENEILELKKLITKLKKIFPKNKIKSNLKKEHKKKINITNSKIIDTSEFEKELNTLENEIESMK